MRLNPNFRYVGIDFETTGLDMKKDSPIQIGIVELNAQGEIIDQFESLIRPDKNIKELKNIVSFLTQIKTAELVFAPTILEIAEKIQHFFTPETIIIGHNVNFDLAFLKMVLPEVQYAGIFDTFVFAQALIPYPPSYALEILVGHLSEKPLFLQQMGKFGLSKEDTDEEVVERYHEALYDTKSTMALFCYLIEFVGQLREKYPALEVFFTKSKEVVLTQLLAIGNERKSSHERLEAGNSLPSLKKIAPTNTSLMEFPYAIDLKKCAHLHRYYVGNLDFKKLLLSLLFNKKILLVFSNKPKLDIAKNVLFDLGIKNIGFAREEQTISGEKFQQFQQKETFNQFELYFLLKYATHLFWGYGVLDLNSKGDYLVYNLIKDERQVINYPVVLTTHHGLYAILEKEVHAYADYDVVFFDVEWRYKNYNAYLSRVCDLYYLQNFLDMMLYKYGGAGFEASYASLKEFDAFFSVFLGVLWTETKKLFLGRAEDELIINPIVGNLDFYQTNKLLPKFKEFAAGLKLTLSDQDFLTIWKQVEHFLEITETVAKITRKVYGQGGNSDFYFLFSEEAKFTNWEEFKEIFVHNHVVFLSNHEAKYSLLCEHEIGTEHKEMAASFLQHVTSFGSFEEKLGELISQGAQSIFVISTIKEESKKLFELVQKLRFVTEYELLVENITGGAGKNIFKAKKQPRKIIIGGYNFLLMCYAQKLHLDRMLVRNIRGAQSQGILDDLMRYRIHD